MKRHVYSRDTHMRIRIDDAEPECGKHFCDICGDCLACYWEDPCNGIAGEEHLWVVYESPDMRHETNEADAYAADGDA